VGSDWDIIGKTGPSGPKTGGAVSDLTGELQDAHAAVTRLREEKERLKKDEEAYLYIIEYNGIKCVRLARWRDLCLDELSLKRAICEGQKGVIQGLHQKRLEWKDKCDALQTEADNANESARMAEDRVARLVEGSKKREAAYDALKARADRLAEALGKIAEEELTYYESPLPGATINLSSYQPLKRPTKAAAIAREALREREEGR
jgi:chromosome segregation ATPase